MPNAREREPLVKWGLIVFVALAGVLNTLQSGGNSMLNKLSGRPVWAVVSVYAIGLAFSLAAALVSGEKLPSTLQIASMPWWTWTGGALGAIYLLSMMLSAEQLGAATFMGLTVTMSIITSLVMDHFGLLGFSVHGAGPGRIGGGLLMVIGLVLIARY